jgi:hypothetical protein
MTAPAVMEADPISDAAAGVLQGLELVTMNAFGL